MNLLKDAIIRFVGGGTCNSTFPQNIGCERPCLNGVSHLGFVEIGRPHRRTLQVMIVLGKNSRGRSPLRVKNGPTRDQSSDLYKYKQNARVYSRFT